MANTDRYEKLKKRVGELRNNLLPRKFSSTGIYTDKEYDEARGYRLLVHAEIESYIEEMSNQVIREALKLWKRKRKSSRALIAFLSCYHSSWNEEDENKIIVLSKGRKKIKEKTEEIIDVAETQFVHRIEDNHGIREKNLKTLILPTGIELDDMDPNWVTDIDDFGKKRGETAHSAKKVKEQINPKDELERVSKIMKGIEALDRKFVKIKKEFKK